MKFSLGTEGQNGPLSLVTITTMDSSPIALLCLSTQKTISDYLPSGLNQQPHTTLPLTRIQ